MKLATLLVLASAALVQSQRPSFAGSKPIGYPEYATTEGSLEDRFGEVGGTTQRLPIEANGDRDLIDRLSKLPVDKQPFWFINWQALEAHRKNPQTYPQKPNPFVDPLPITGNANLGNSGFSNLGNSGSPNLGNSGSPNLGSSVLSNLGNSGSTNLVNSGTTVDNSASSSPTIPNRNSLPITNRPAISSDSALIGDRFGGIETTTDYNNQGIITTLSSNSGSGNSKPGNTVIATSNVNYVPPRRYFR